MKKYLTGGILFFLLVMLCFIFLGIEAVPRNYIHQESGDGPLDGADVDFEKDIVMIYPDRFTHYPEQLLAPDEAGVPGEKTVAPYGTYRLSLLLQEDAVYAMSQTANDMALLTMADGQVLGKWGTVGASVEESRARGGALVTSFSPDTGEAELSYQYSGFIRRYKPPSIYLGSVEQIAAQQQRMILRDMLFVVCFFTAGLLFLGMFLFFGRRSQYLYFSLFCLCLMTEKLVTGILPLTVLLLLSGAAVARIEYLAVLYVLVFLALYANATFRGVFHRWAKYLILIGFALYTACVLLLHPYTFTEMRDGLLTFRWVVLLYGVGMLLWKVRKPQTDQGLALLGILLFAGVNLAEKTVFRWILPYRFGNGFLTSCISVGVIFLFMIALSLAARRAEQALEETRLREQTLREENRMLDRLNAMKTEFFTNVSHEMKTPLTVMSVNAQVSKAMVESGVDREMIYANLDVVTAETMRLSRMVNDMLELGNLQEGRAERLSLSPLLAKTAAVCEALVNKRGNRLRLSVPETLPPVEGSADRLIQVVVNLLSNAAIHTKDGLIELEARVQENEITVHVADTGTGVEEDLLPFVFERHVRGARGGSGLGLPICKEIIEQHGGAITLENRQDGGCIVRFTLPIANDGGEDSGEDI